MWAIFQTLAQKRTQGTIAFRKVKGHASMEDILEAKATNADKLGNTADHLAATAWHSIDVLGANLHAYLNHRMDGYVLFVGLVTRFAAHILAEDATMRKSITNIRSHLKDSFINVHSPRHVQLAMS